MDLCVTEPVDCLDFLHLMKHEAVLVTYSGRIQGESPYVQVPSFAVLENTERPATVEIGANELVPLYLALIFGWVHGILADERPSGQVPSVWD